MSDMETKKVKVLLIDDDEMLLKSLLPVFEKNGFEVLTATDGDAGLLEALNNEPEIVITDIEMKNVDGMEVLKEIRKTGEWGEKVPVILLTNYDANDRIIEGIVHDRPSLYLLKSKVDPKTVLEKVQELLSVTNSKK